MSWLKNTNNKCACMKKQMQVEEEIKFARGVASGGGSRSLPAPVGHRRDGMYASKVFN